MLSLLRSIAELQPVSYASLLKEYEHLRACRVASDLQRLRMRDYVEYDSGRYTITVLGTEYLNEHP